MSGRVFVGSPGVEYYSTRAKLQGHGLRLSPLTEDSKKLFRLEGRKLGGHKSIGPPRLSGGGTHISESYPIALS